MKFSSRKCRYLPTKSTKTSFQKIDQSKRLLQKAHFGCYRFNLLWLDINHQKSDTIVLCHEFSQFWYCKTGNFCVVQFSQNIVVSINLRKLKSAKYFFPIFEELLAYMVAVCGSYLFACGNTSNIQLFIMSKCYIHANLFKIRQLVHELLCTQASVGSNWQFKSRSDLEK